MFPRRPADAWLLSRSLYSVESESFSHSQIHTTAWLA
jgi:hypothetical protein